MQGGQAEVWIAAAADHPKFTSDLTSPRSSHSFQMRSRHYTIEQSMLTLVLS